MPRHGKSQRGGGPVGDKGYKPGTLHWHRNTKMEEYCLAEWNGSAFIFFNREYEARTGYAFEHGVWEYANPLSDRYSPKFVDYGDVIP